MVTPEELERCRQAMRSAQDDMDGAADLPAGPQAAQMWAAARARLDQASAALRNLEQRAADEQAEAASREKLEFGMADQIDAATAALADTRRVVTAAVTAAQKAAVAVTAATIRHNALIAATGAQLSAAGLTVPDGAEYATGALARGAGVVLRGATHRTVDPAGMLTWILHRVADAALPNRNTLSALLKYNAGRMQAARAAGTPLADVPDVKVPVTVTA